MEGGGGQRVFTSCSAISSDEKMKLSGFKEEMIKEGDISQSNSPYLHQ